MVYACCLAEKHVLNIMAEEKYLMCSLDFATYKETFLIFFPAKTSPN
jgi:hypothetical protein